VAEADEIQTNCGGWHYLSMPPNADKQEALRGCWRGYVGRIHSVPVNATWRKTQRFF